MISPLAYIHPEAKIGENVEIAPFVFIDKNVVIGDNNKIMANANILYGSRIGNGNTIFPGAVIGAIPQDLKFRGEETTAEIGNNNTIRENVTINRGTAAKGKTIVGSNNLLMEGVHVAHDAFIGNGCIIGNSTKMAGEIHRRQFHHQRQRTDAPVLPRRRIRHDTGRMPLQQRHTAVHHSRTGTHLLCRHQHRGTAPSRFLQRNHRGHSQRLPHHLSKRTEQYGSFEKD